MFDALRPVPIVIVPVQDYIALGDFAREVSLGADTASGDPDVTNRFMDGNKVVDGVEPSSITTSSLRE